MAARSKYLFVTPEEFVKWLPATAGELGLHIILDHIPTRPLVHWSGASEELLAAWRLYLSMEKTDLTIVNPIDFIGQKLGWIDVDVPKVKGSYLQRIDTGVKSDWSASTEEPSQENPEVLKLFDRFWRRWKKHFTYGLVTKISRNYCRDVGYSPGAEEWVRRGGTLTHRIGEGLEFDLPS